MSDKTPKITELTTDQASKILSSAGGRRITPDMVLADIASGFTANADGTIHLINYMAWLVSQNRNGANADGV